MKIFFFYLLLFFLFQSCSSKKAPQEARETVPEREGITLTEAQMKNAAIEMGAVRRQTIKGELVVYGDVDVPPQNIVSVSFPMGGYLRSTKLLPGMHVKKGEVIGVMEDPSLVQLQQDYLVTKAKLGFLQKEYERQKQLNENKVNSDKVLQQAEAEYNSQKAVLKGYAEKLKLIGINPDRLNENNISGSVPIYSSIDGFVSKVNVNIGKYVQATDVLFELINPDDIHASLTVFEKDISSVAIGQNVKVSFVDDPGKEYEAEIILVNRNMDENRSAVIHCHFLTKPKQLLPGMFLNAKILVSQSNVHALPEESIVRYANKQYVFVEKGSNSFEMMEVETGIKEGDSVEIKNGAGLEGKKLVVKNAYSVLGALKNKPEEE